MATTEQQKADLSKARGAIAGGIKDTGEKKKFIAKSADIDKNYDDVAQGASIEYNRQNREAVLGSFKKGGDVKKTGNYKLHEGEKVVPADKADKVNDLMKKAEGALTKEEKSRGSKKAKHNFKHTHVEHHKHDGSHTVRHTPEPEIDENGISKPGDDITYAAKDNDDLQAQMAAHLGGGQAGPEDEAAPAEAAA